MSIVQSGAPPGTSDLEADFNSSAQNDLMAIRDKLRRKKEMLTEVKADLASTQDRLHSARNQAALVAEKSAEVEAELRTYASSMRIHEVHQITKKDERELVDDFRRIVDSIALGIRDQQAHDDEELARADLEVKARAEATALGLDYTSGNEDEQQQLLVRNDTAAVEVVFHKRRHAGATVEAVGAQIGDDDAISATCARHRRRHIFLSPRFYASAACALTCLSLTLTPVCSSPRGRSPAV